MSADIYRTTRVQMSSSNAVRGEELVAEGAVVVIADAHVDEVGESDSCKSPNLFMFTFRLQSIYIIEAGPNVCKTFADFVVAKSHALLLMLVDPPSFSRVILPPLSISLNLKILKQPNRWLWNLKTVKISINGE